MGRIDPEAVSEALLNLLDNATKYAGRADTSRCPSGERVLHCRLGRRPRRGHSKDDLPNIFDKFYRARTQQTRETPGSASAWPWSGISSRRMEAAWRSRVNSARKPVLLRHSASG